MLGRQRLSLILNEYKTVIKCPGAQPIVDVQCQKIYAAAEIKCQKVTVHRWCWMSITVPLLNPILYFRSLRLGGIGGGGGAGWRSSKFRERTAQCANTVQAVRKTLTCSRKQQLTTYRQTCPINQKKHATWTKLNSDFWVERFLNMKPYQLNNENELKDK